MEVKMKMKNLSAILAMPTSSYAVKVSQQFIA